MPSVEERLRYWRTRAQRMQVALEDISTDTVQGPLDDELGLIMRMQDVAKGVLGDDPSEFDQLRAKIERLTKALEPFCKHYEPWMERWDDQEASSTFSRHTFGDIREALAALRDARSAQSTSREGER